MGKIPNRGMGKWNVCETDWGIDNGDVEVAITASSIMVTDHTNGNVDRQVSILVAEEGIEALVGMLGPHTGYAEAQFDSGWLCGKTHACERADALIVGWANKHQGKRIGKANIEALLKAIDRIDS